MREPKEEKKTWREEQTSFYSSVAWQNLREAVKKERGGLCERCRKKGIFKAADLIHHIIAVTPDNINDPAITLNPKNLMALCTECHEEIHDQDRRRHDPPAGSRKRWDVDPETGKVTARRSPPSA